MAGQSKEQDAVPSLGLRLSLLGGYAALIAVNAIFGKGMYGVPTNGELSAKWPSQVTPAGYAFAIWGGIFLLQGAGVVWAQLPSKAGSSKAKAINAVGPAWLSVWAFENAWQLTFWQIANVEPTDSIPRQLSVFVPCSLLLWGGLLSALTGCERLKRSGAEGGATGVMYKLATALNAGWLSAATCIGMSLVTHSALGGVDKTPLVVPLALAGLATGGGMCAVAYHGAGWTGLGYAGAVMWALQAVRFGNHVPNTVRGAALAGVIAVGGASLATPFLFPSKKTHTI